MHISASRRTRAPAPLRAVILSLIAVAPFLSLLAPGQPYGSIPASDAASAAHPSRATPTASPTPAPTRTARPSPTPTRTPRHKAHPASKPARTTSRHAPARPTPHTVSYDRYSMLIDGHRVILFGGEYQFWRTPAPDRWPAVLAEMRAAGLNTVTVGVSWQYHSPAPGRYNFSGIRDLGRFLDDAAAAGLYVIARPGPAYNAESSASNLPGWLLARSGNLRDNGGSAYCGDDAYSTAYAAAYTDWFRHVLPIIASRQLTRGTGTVVALQIENEYSPLCGTVRYMSELHDLARELGIDVPLLANNNTCCTAAGSWHVRGDDGQPIVDLPAEDDYPCPLTCSPNWNGSIFRTVDTMETRLRKAGVTDAPIAVAELQGGYYTGWGGPSYSQVNATLSPAFREVLDGSVLGQGATLVSLYMVAGGTSWGYLAGPDTATSYDYAAPIHEWGDPGASYDALKRTGMFVQAYSDVLAATRRSQAVSATNPALLYAARETVGGPQRGAMLIVLRNTDPAHWHNTRLRLTIGGRTETIPQARGTSIQMPPHSLYLLVAGVDLGAGVHLRYSTSRPLTLARANGQKLAVFYGQPGTAGETVLDFPRAPRVLRADAGIALHYDAHSHELRLDYRQQERARYVVLDEAGQRLVIALTGPQGAAHTWRLSSAAGDTLIMGPNMVAAVASSGGHPQLTIAPGTTPLTVWSPGGSTRLSLSASGSGSGTVSPHVGARRPTSQAVRLASPSPGYDSSVHAATSGVVVAQPKLALPALTTWRFSRESPESAPSFDDSHWVKADERATSNPNVPRSDTLLADDYGFHYGFVWYRGRFRGTGSEQYLRLYARNSYSVWLNGRYLGSSSLNNDLKNIDDQLAVTVPKAGNGAYADGLFFRIPRGLVHTGATNTIAVLVESLGHNTGFANGELARSPMGILDALLIGPAAAPHIAWKIQGAAGGEQSFATAHDGVDTPLNASGLYGERNGWYRTNFDDSHWGLVHVPDSWAARGLHYQGVGWYRTTFSLNLPADVDAPLGLVIPHAQDKVMIWLNGLLIGQYWDGVGPQHVFYLPAGLLHERGRNTLALAVWNRGHGGGLTGGVYLQPYSVDVTAILDLAR